jgi:hypothetical protein
MNVRQNIEHRLWDFIDGSCNFQEKMLVKRLIANDENWYRKYQELTQVHQVINDSLKLHEPSPGFLEKVMRKIAAVK